MRRAEKEVGLGGGVWMRSRAEEHGLKRTMAEEDEGGGGRGLRRTRAEEAEG